jgi:hypothetical protein
MPPPFGSALNLNPHFHVLFVDGGYVRGKEGGVRFRPARAHPSDVEALIEEIATACEARAGTTGPWARGRGGRGRRRRDAPLQGRRCGGVLRGERGLDEGGAPGSAHRGEGAGAPAALRLLRRVEPPRRGRDGGGSIGKGCSGSADICSARSVGPRWPWTAWRWSRRAGSFHDEADL